MSFILKADKDAAAKLISSNTEAFDAFEQAYKSASMEDENDSFFGLSAKGAIKKAHNLPEDESHGTGCGIISARRAAYRKYVTCN